MNSFGIVNFGLFCAAVLLLNATPGPDTAYIIGRSVAQGRAAGLVSALGISVGCLFHCLASAFGLTAILATSAMAFTLIKLAGGAYLIYLGIRMALAKPIRPTDAPVMKDVRPLKTVFWQAVVTNILNPKVVLFFLSFFPQFVRSDAPHKTVAFLLLGATFVAMSTVWNSGTAFLAGTLARRAGRNPRVKLWLERVVGSAFVALGIKLATTRH
ncbi:LysE family translocator [Undibacterium sp.]|jgi:RhtB (resistance to homoserine/threonine) family protein|uniref:LysE family translocator n=1 Tax=Undibacterium sp. TaxID=1914977 RepID=UPI002BAA26E1|nr:LysE family translocator [Undibacterium sp.]HTD04032.1 LysE family translocator [Undibacterium sp.]